jgi:TonB family protein
MVFVRRILCCILICSPLAAQVAPSPLKAVDKLKSRVVFLRNMNSGDKLTFDAQGKALNNSTPEPFAYSAVKIEKVHHSETELSIKGSRVALVFDTASTSPSLSDIRFILLKEPVDIAIALDPSHPETLDTALWNVFAFTLQDALSHKTPEDEAKDLDTLGSTAPLNGSPTSTRSGSDASVLTVLDYRRQGKEIIPPRLIYSVQPAYTDDARRRKFNGICVLNMIVDTSGYPTHIRIPRSLDPGLDLNAIIATSQYRFTPAMYNGHPVPVAINIEVNYRIW